MNGFAYIKGVKRRKVEYRLITLEEASAKQIELEQPVTDPSLLVLDVDGGGVAQFIDQDFEIFDNQVLSWAGKGLDGLIEAGDKFRIVYE